MAAHPTAAPPLEPWRLVYDGDCGFCRYTVEYARAVTDVEAGGSLRYEPYQRVAADYPDLTVDDFRNSIRLFTPTSRHHGADAAFRVLARAPRLRGWAWCYATVPLFAWFAELLYRFTARHRGAMYRIARPLFGSELRPADYARTSDLIIRGVGLSALCAFASWWWQAAGLIGSHGILPVADYFEAAHAQLGPLGWLQLPSLYWISAADWMTTTLCALGVVASALMAARVFATVAALVAYVCYLSLEYGGGVFLEFQWDILLIETLLIAAVLSRQPRIGIWLARLLVFRFMFLSGVVKLISGDPTWHGLSALDYHFETQPLPTVFAWYFDQLPRGVLHSMTAATLSVELVLPFFIFGPRNLRHFAAAMFIALELLILVTGNYNFFNFLTIVLCLALLDDRTLRAHVPVVCREAAPQAWRMLLVVFATLGALQIHQTLGRGTFAGWEAALLRLADPLQAVNSYGLFAVMTTERDELIVEGSNDGLAWQALDFKYKPQALDEAPRWVAPYQPRLDWQMWFAALTSREGAPWVGNLLVRLLNGEPDVARLMRPSPFAEPPRFIRIVRYRYTFTTAEQREQTGAWWAREYLGVWFPPARVADTHRAPDGDVRNERERSDAETP